MNLNLTDGALLIDNSGLETFCKCPLLYYYERVLKRTLSEAKPGRNFGSAIHAGLKALYLKQDIHKAVLTHFNQNPQPEGEFRDFDHAMKMLDIYQKLYAEDDKVFVHNGKPLVEVTFMHKWCDNFDIPVYYYGRIDLVIQRDDEIWVRDHKTTFMFGNGHLQQSQVNQACLGYAWALNQVGLDVAGYEINGIRVRAPSATGIAPVDKTDFLRLPFIITQSQMDEWYENTDELIRLLIETGKTGYFPMYRTSCVQKYGTCDFFSVCDCPKQSRELMLHSNLYAQNDWTSLNPVVEDKTTSKSKQQN